MMIVGIAVIALVIGWLVRPLFGLLVIGVLLLFWGIAINDRPNSWRWD